MIGMTEWRGDTYTLNTLNSYPAGQNGRHFADDLLRRMFVNQSYTSLFSDTVKSTYFVWSKWLFGNIIWIFFCNQSITKSDNYSAQSIQVYFVDFLNKNICTVTPNYCKAKSGSNTLCSVLVALWIKLNPSNVVHGWTFVGFSVYLPFCSEILFYDFYDLSQFFYISEFFCLFLHVLWYSIESLWTYVVLECANQV